MKQKRVLCCVVLLLAFALVVDAGCPPDKFLDSNGICQSCAWCQTRPEVGGTSDDVQKFLHWAGVCRNFAVGCAQAQWWTTSQMRRKAATTIIEDRTRIASSMYATVTSSSRSELPVGTAVSTVVKPTSVVVSNNKALFIGGAIAAAVLFVVVFVILVLLWRRRRHKRDKLRNVGQGRGDPEAGDEAETPLAGNGAGTLQANNHFGGSTPTIYMAARAMADASARS